MTGSASWPGSVSCGSPHTGARAAFGKPGYAEVLRGLGISGTGEVLVAEDNGRIHRNSNARAVPPLRRDRPQSRRSRSPGAGRGAARAAPGAGRALVAAVIERVTAKGIHRLLSAQPAMTAAEHLFAWPGSAGCQNVTGAPPRPVAARIRSRASARGCRNRSPSTGAKGHLVHPHEVKVLGPIRIAHQTPRPRCPKERPRISDRPASLCISSDAAARL